MSQSMSVNLNLTVPGAAEAASKRETSSVSKLDGAVGSRLKTRYLGYYFPFGIAETEIEGRKRK